MVTPYLVFGGNCAQALEFYQAVFGGMPKGVMPYGDYVPEGLETVPENLAQWVLHAEMDICGTNVWLADEPAAPTAGSGIRLSASVATAGEAKSIFGKLAREGQVVLPPTETFYSTFHAAAVDRFGIHWNVVAEEAPTAASGGAQP